MNTPAKLPAQQAALRRVLVINETNCIPMKLDTKQQIALNERIIRDCETQIAYRAVGVLLDPSDCSNSEICHQIDCLMAQVERLEIVNRILKAEMGGEVQS